MSASQTSTATVPPSQLPQPKATENAPTFPPFVAGTRVDLFRLFPPLYRFVRLRWFQLAVILPNLLVFSLFILAGFVGTPVGNRNIIIVFIWILWWFLLIATLVPFGSRLWCTVCPLPFFGDWFQRRRLVAVRPGSTSGLHNVMSGLNRRWPQKLSNIWLQNIGFLTLCSFSAMLVTRPVFTASLLLGLMVLALILATVFRMRTFCNYICPISGFLSLFSMTSTLELRQRDADVCQKCKSKACRTGSENSWACFWMIYMGKLDRNNYCGLCMDCVKSCPNDNIALNLRPFAADIRLHGFDEAWKAFIMLTLAMAYSVTLLGPYGTVKDWANVTETGMWGGFLVYVGIIWVTALALVPGVFYLACRVARRLAGAEQVAMGKVFLGYAYLLVPLGLLAWIAFSIPLIFINGTYILTVLSDPFGWGWNLFGTALVKWHPLIPEYLVYLQMPLLAIAVYYVLRRGLVIGEQMFGSRSAAMRALVPVGAFCTAMMLAFLLFFAG